METNQANLILAKDAAEDLHDKYDGKSTVMVKIGDVTVEIGETSIASDRQKIIAEFSPMLKAYIGLQVPKKTKKES